MWSKFISLSGKMIHSFTRPASRQKATLPHCSKWNKSNKDMDKQFSSEAEKYQSIIQDNKSLLVKNIILTPEFFEVMVRHKMITNSMVGDIKSKETREKQNARFLEVYPLRTAHMYTTLCDTLQMTGHALLADHLRDEAADPKSQKEDKDLYRLIPTLQTGLDSREICTLHAYIAQKVKEAVHKQDWKNGATDKQKAMDAKRQQIEQAGDFKEKLTEKEKQLSEMRMQLETLKQECKGKDSQISNLQGLMQKATSELKEEYKKQVKFSISTNSDNKRLQERLNMFNQEIRQMNIQARECLLEVADDGIATKETIRTDPDNIKVSCLENNIERLIDKIRELKAKMENIRVFYEEDRKGTLKTLNVPDTIQSAHDAADLFVRRVESESKALMKEIFQLSDMLFVDEIGIAGASQRSLRNETAPPMEKTKVEIGIIRDQIQHLMNVISSHTREIQQHEITKHNLESQVRQLGEANTELELKLKEQNQTVKTLNQEMGILHRENTEGPAHNCDKEAVKLPPLQKVVKRQPAVRHTNVQNVSLFDEGIIHARRGGFRGSKKGFHKSTF
ncbi:CAP-Gly domain-containing linker protein 1 [Lingula anatina]|uniref:CAP-Gly domain-containing linker protein 1 n=1 Tax=Lingula anatina TaxID=7574 RepID=A0A1S3HEM8_LINAN|nr:CAP-Gly domain-containing linker protein 1 [Lingula anatina]|eukprot:XP_013384475.1 CAP-Gly domain-containing linker protein 1 [Lingula anatina]